MSEITLGQVWRSLTVAQAWVLSASVVAVLSGTFGLGVFFQSLLHNATISGKEREISRLNAELDSVRLANQGATAELRQQVADARRTSEALEKGLAAAIGDRDAFEGKAEFLHRYIEYIQTHHEISKKLLVDVVCKMWRDTQRRRISIERQPLEVSAGSLASGLDAETMDLLMKNGVSSELIERVQRPENFVNRAVVQPFDRTENPEEVRERALSSIVKQASGISVVKFVTFFDGMRYQMPDEIAAAVHTHPECSPL
jgi:hypothetical protein